MGSPEFESPHRSWRFTWESLAHIAALRLYLFRPPLDPSTRCRSLSAALGPDRSMLLVSWVDGDRDGEVELRVPVPRVLFDPNLPAECRARCDHIEVKLALALPLDHPLVADFVAGVLDSEGERPAERSGGIGVSDQLLPLSLDSDIKCLSSGGVLFFCKTCSTKLTRKPVSHFVEMPSSNWREIADNWFGACCCSFGGVSEKIVSQYIDKYNCEVGTCLLDGASVTICKDDLEDYVVQLEPNTKDKPAALVNICNAIESSKGGDSRNHKEGIHNLDTTLSFSSCKVVRTDIDIAKSPSMDTKPCDPLIASAECCKNIPNVAAFNATSISGQLRFSEDSPDVSVNVLDLNIDHCSEKPDKHFPVPLKSLSLENCDHCCGETHESMLSALSASILSSEAKQAIQSSGLQGSLTSLHNGSFGGGFIIRTSNIFKDTKWVGFLCRNCSSPLGCYPSSKNANFPIDGGIRLFKCFISTSSHVDGTRDIFRKHTMPRVFVNLLLENAEDELSYRIIVKDLESRYPRLQLVLLSSKAWWSTGYCIENNSGEEVSRTNMQPVVKLLFTECDDTSEGNSRLVEEWLKKNHVEEVYMMPFLIEELITHLKSASNSIPLSCSSLQGMCLSYLQR